jgi:cytochrome P450
MVRDHRRLRGPVVGAFTARRVAALRPRIEEIADGLLDRLDSLSTDKPVDLREHYTHPLPITVICELSGVVDETTREEVARCSDVVFNVGKAPEQVATAFSRLRDILRDLIAGKRERPGDDISSALIAACDGDSPPLSEDELVGVRDRGPRDHRQPARQRDRRAAHPPRPARPRP